MNKRLKKITKTQARIAFLKDKTVFAIPCKLNPYYMDGIFLIEFNPEFLLENKWDTTLEKCFDSLYSECTWYNCNAHEGRYLHFYIEA